MTSTCRNMILVIACSAATVARADVLLEYVDSGRDCHGEFTRMALSGARLRIEPPPPNADYAMLYDGREKLAITLDARNRSYFEMEMDADALDYQGDVMSSTSTMIERKLAEVRGAQARDAVVANAAMAAPLDAKVRRLMDQGMQAATPEQHEQMQRSLDDLRASGVQVPGLPAGAPAAPSAPAVEVEVEAQTRTLAGFTCTMQRVRVAGELQREECVAVFDSLGLAPAELIRLQKSLRNFSALSKATSRLRIAGVASPAPAPAEPGGLAIERRCFEHGTLRGSATLRISRPTLPDGTFDVPADYRRMDLRNAGAGAQ